MPRGVYERAPSWKRIYDKVLIGDGCWTFQTSSSRYPMCWHGGKVMSAHRAVYEMFVGPIPDGYEIDHLCKNTRCLRWSHLEAVTTQVNHDRQDRWQSKKTHCPQGHPYEGENLMRTKHGYRKCRTCQRRHVRQSLAKRKGK